jgi:serine/threonine-protein kinase
VELDSGSVSARRSLGYVYIYARHYDQAQLHGDRAIAMNPNAEESYRVLGLALALDGQFDEAERVLREVTAAAEINYTYATLGYVLARAGKESEARTVLRRLEEQRARDYVSPVALATIYLGLGELDAALDWTEAAYDERRGWLAYLKVNPLMDPIRGHPRFEQLVKRMKL